MIHDEARVAELAVLGESISIWQGAVVREGARIGTQTTVGMGAYIGSGVVVGDRCKIQNYACVYEQASLGDGVFVGPGAILTNDQHPRAINPDGSIKGVSDWSAVGVVVGEGASIGAH
ncbi:MAG TPA: N-acetyltransferase, partial [Verrucomicrobiales bacterium]|nr:N-acetyltransferase [Verrucomicrobiales bacterium]